MYQPINRYNSEKCFSIVLCLFLMTFTYTIVYFNNYKYNYNNYNYTDSISDLELYKSINDLKHENRIIYLNIIILYCIWII